jgi:hypothetical protein
MTLAERVRGSTRDYIPGRYHRHYIRGQYIRRFGQPVLVEVVGVKGDRVLLTGLDPKKRRLQIWETIENFDNQKLWQPL